MTILHTETEVLTVQRTTVQLADGSIVRVFEYTDNNGKVVDSIVRSKHGYEIDDLALIDKIYDFMDNAVNAEDGTDSEYKNDYFERRKNDA